MATKNTKKIADQKNQEHNGHPIAAGENGRVLSSFKLGERGDAGVISISEYKGKKALDIRRYYLDDASEEYRPTSKGIRIPAEQVAEFLDALGEHRNAIMEALL